jgi:hypothetical protein
MQRDVGQTDQLAHSLVPLELAVLAVRDKVYGPQQPGSDPNAIAAFIAATFPVYEYTDDPSVQPRALTQAHSAGLFRNGGRELHFLDGTPAKRCLAVKAEDVSRAIALLKEQPPEQRPPSS